MKKHLLLMLSLLMANMFLNAETTTDWQEANLFGKVKILKSDYETTTFNASGYMEAVINGNANWYDGDTIYTYDKNNRLITVIGHDRAKKECVRINKTYDTNGLLIKEVRKDYTVETEKLEYNSKKQLVWKKTYNEDGSLYHASEFTYNSAGNQISEKEYDEDMKLYNKTICTYDSNNKLMEKREYKVRDTEILDEVYSYNADGNLVEETTYDQGEVYSRRVVTYDAKSNVSSEITTEPSYSTSTTYSYEYDSQGNWIVRERYENGKLKGTERREIIYY